MDDELLREASDPTTPGERLREMFLVSLRLCYSFPGGIGGPHAQVARCLMRNPSLPSELLREYLIQRPASFCSVDAWYNPMLPVLLLSDPSPEYQRGAFQTLRTLEKEDVQRIPHRPRGLARTVATWALTSPSSPRSAAARDLARHLADLFGLPWAALPGDTSSASSGQAPSDGRTVTGGE